MLKAVIFDLDGVIVDSHPAHMEAWRSFFRSLGKQVSEEELSFVLEGQKREDILRHFLGDLTNEQIRQYGAHKEALFKDGVEQLAPIEGLFDFLEEIKLAGLPIALASSASRGRAEYMLRALGLEGRFQVVVAGDDVSKGKPDPSIFLLAAEKIGVDPQYVLVCEDAVNGVAGAKSAGMKCLAIAHNGRGPTLKNAGADLVIQDFTQASVARISRLFPCGSSSKRSNN